MKALFFKFPRFYNNEWHDCIGLALGDTNDDLWDAIDQVCDPSECEVRWIKRRRYNTSMQVSWIMPLDTAEDEEPTLFEWPYEADSLDPGEKWEPSPWAEDSHPDYPELPGPFVRAMRKHVR